MKKALVSGVTSFLGRELAASLQADGIEVHAVVRPGSDLGLLRDLPRAPVLHVHDGGDAALGALVAAAQPDTIFHLAGRYLRDHKPDDVEGLIRDNVQFGTQLLEAAQRAGCRRFVNTGSYVQFLDGDAFRPLNLYAAAKQAFADIMAYYRDAGGLQTVTLIVFDTYGPRDRRPRLMNAIRDAQRHGTDLPLPKQDVTVDFVFGDDVIGAFRRAADLLATRPEGISGGTFAVTSGERRTIAEIVALFEEAGGKPVRVRRGEWPDAPRAVAALWNGPVLPGWRPAVPLREGIRRLIGES